MLGWSTTKRARAAASGSTSGSSPAPYSPYSGAQLIGNCRLRLPWREGRAVPVAKHPFGQEAEVGAADLAGLALHQQPGVALGAAPLALRVGHQHLQHAAVAVEVLGVEAAGVLLPGEVAPVAHRAVGGREADLGAVRVEPRDDVDGPRVEQLGHLGVAAVGAEQQVDRVERHGRGDDLLAVVVGVDMERGLVGRRPRGAVRDGHAPDGAAATGAPDRRQRRELRCRGDAALEPGAELVVRQVAVVGEGVHGRSASSGSATSSHTSQSFARASRMCRRRISLAPSTSRRSIASMSSGCVPTTSSSEA